MIMSKDRKLVATGNVRNRTITNVNDIRDGERLLTYKTKGRAVSAFTKHGFYGMKQLSTDNPLEAVPSHLSLKEREWQILGSPLEKYACRDFILETSEHWYNYPLARLKELPNDQKIIVRFDDLVSNAEQAVKQIYDRFNLSISETYGSILNYETIQARNHQSQHVYSLTDMGLKSEQLKERYENVLSEFDFG